MTPKAILLDIPSNSWLQYIGSRSEMLQIKKQVNVAYAQSEKSNPKYKKLKSTGDVIAECIISPSLLSPVRARDYAGCRSCKNNT